MAFVVFDNVSKDYKTGSVIINALHDISFEINKGEIVVIVGESGAGKTTLLNILGGMDNLTSGKIYVDDEEISQFNKKQLVEYRRYSVGFVFQFYNLIPSLTALENIEMATYLCKDAISPEQIIKDVGLEDRKKNFPAQLSGGEQQRVAIGRALAKNPKLLLCDEPTGALDYNTGKSILKLLQDTARKNNMTVIIITHNKALTSMADRIIHIKSGTILSTNLNDNVIPVENLEW